MILRYSYVLQKLVEEYVCFQRQTSWNLTRSAQSAWEDECPFPQVFYVEAISNPKLEVGDLKGVAAFSKEHSLTSVIDATFTPPVNFRPAAIGFNIVLHSATKYYNGHSDIVAGVVAGSRENIAKVLAFSFMQ